MNNNLDKTIYDKNEIKFSSGSSETNFKLKTEKQQIQLLKDVLSLYDKHQINSILQNDDDIQIVRKIVDNNSLHILTDNEYQYYITRFLAYISKSVKFKMKTNKELKNNG